MTSETSNFNETQTTEQAIETPLDTTVETCKRLLEYAYTKSCQAQREGQTSAACYWDGYIRGIQNILESQHE